MMSVFSKLMQARIKLQSLKLSKSGKNTFAGYQYFELGDFLPQVQEIFAELGLCGIVSYTTEIASLTIIDCDNPDDKIVITSPMGSAALKGCHEVQNIGAVETYQRRYLWVTAMEIVEHDALDATVGKEPAEKPKASISPNDVGKDYWNNAEGEEKEFLNLCLSTVRDFLAVPDGQAAANHFYAIGSIEEQAAVWSQLGSKERATIKQFKPAKAA
jgi:hypothetical protein